MSVQELNPARTGRSKEYRTTQLQRWLVNVAGAVIGMVGGAIGVALTIGLMIIAAQISAIVFYPNSYMLIGVSIVFGLGISWLLERMLRYVSPILNTSHQQNIQVIFVFSILIVLLEGFLFL